MDTTEVAARLKTSPRLLRQFLRSPMSTFVAVGSGARYDFDETDLTTLARRFSEWKGAGKPAPVLTTTPPKAKKRTTSPRDLEVWAEEEANGGFPKLEDIRNPRVRARVLADAHAAEDRLMMMLMAAGRHVTQSAVRRVVA